MEENSELEEGETCYYKDDVDNNNNIDPDSTLSYIDEKLQSVLGHFQKDFEGGVSAENLGAKFGGYGSFLPTYERSPAIGSRPKTPRKSSSTPRSPNNLPQEGATQSMKAPSDGPTSAKLGSALHSTEELHNSGATPGDVSVQLDPGSLPVLVAQRSTMKDENSNKSGYRSEQRTLKVRIKVCSDNMALKNAAMYSGLGLDNSPSTSLGNSLEESGGMLPVAQEIADESPTSILQVMTSFPVSGSNLISPLHDNLLCLMRKERLLCNAKPEFPLKGNQEPSALLADEAISVLSNGNLSRRKETELPVKSERGVQVKHGKGVNFENDTSSSAKKRSNTEIPVGNKARGRLSFSDSVKEDSLDSISWQNSGKSEKRSARSSSVEKVSEYRAVTNKTVPSEVVSNASNCKEDFNVGLLAPSKQKIFEPATFHVWGETAVPSVKEKPSLEGEKDLQGTGSSKKAANVLKKESLRVDGGVATKDMNGASNAVIPSREKVHKMKLHKDCNTVRDDHGDCLDTKLEQMIDRVTSWERPSGDRMKDSVIDDLAMQQNASFIKPKEKFSGEGVKNQPMAASSVKAAAYAGPGVTGNALISELVPPLVHPVVIKENWVCCDSCQKWRLLPIGMKPEQLPEKWLCGMLTWLPGMNRCDISEEETTNAVQALGLQNKMQNLANGIGLGVTPVQVHQNQQALDPQVGSSRGKRKPGLTEIAKAGGSCGLIRSLSSTDDDLEEFVKSRSLNDMNQLPEEPNLTNKSSLQHLRDNSQVKKKNKREADPHVCGNSMKAKRDDVYYAGKDQNFDMDTLMVSGFPTKTSEKNMLKSNKSSSLENVNHDTKERLLVSVAKCGDQAQAPSDGGFLDGRSVDKRDASLKKRKLEWQDNQNGHGSNNIQAEESNNSGLKKGKKSRVSQNMSKDFIMKNAGDTSVSVGKDLPIDVMEDKDRRPQKHGRNFACEQTLDGVDSLRKDFGPGQASVAATSSSSKISGSLKTRATFDDLKGSPVESVSSSPLRTSIPEKLNSSGRGINGCLPVIGKPRRCWEVDSDGEIDQSVAAGKDKSSGHSHPERLKFFPSDNQDVNVNPKTNRKAKSSSDLLHVDIEMMEQRNSKNCHEEDRADKKHLDNVLFHTKSVKGSSWSKDKDRSSASDSEKNNNVKVSNPVHEQEDLCSKKGTRHDPVVDPKSYAALHRRMNGAKHSIPEKANMKSSKDKKNNVNRSDAIVPCSKDSTVKKELALEDYDDSYGKLGASGSRNGNSVLQQNLIRVSEVETKVDLIPKESRSRKQKLFPHSDGKGKQESQNHPSVLGPQHGELLDSPPVEASGSIDVQKALKHPRNGGTKNGTQQNLRRCAPDLRGIKDFNAPSPGGINSPSQTATYVLKEAKDLRDYADRLKSSGFGFESNESYFQAAQKFLLGASLLETRNIEIAKPGEMTQMQACSIAAKLCKCCALEYENRHEMAAAALAYKCMEVAFWRVVYCKSSTSSRDHNELQASLQMIPEGESPSSSASDVDNLNNQVPVDKAALSKGSVQPVAGNPIIVARNHTNFLRLLDFTLDVNFAMEASRKSQNALSAANVALEETDNKDCVTSVKKAIDFSFQDVEGFTRLVQLAMEAISRSSFGDARD